MNNTWDDATLSAYIDGELDADRQNAVLAAMEHNKALSERICSLRRTKDWMRTGYGSATPPPRELPGRKFSWRNLRAGVAASVMALAIGTGAGLLAYGYAEHDDAMARSASSDPHRIVLHIDDSDPEHFGQLLDFTESFLQENRDNGAQVEVVANSGGLDLLRTDRSPYQQRVRELSAKYSNLQFIACMNAIRNLKRAGSDVPLIDDVHTGETAIDHVVKRLQQGWTYRKIDSL
ncbi:intracellular sulfur oxidation DsrE/DsrF family protein [Thiogranum longum]|uniref:Intracellular sulfur oxidation DsrE/DsrF family protein n=2 Tax=Thiogranum longum TaxID=1537524 RepID=A0A4R1H8R2_9GAMM|nr:intracellular sulfur oxidation DsrE/DsrF family protein [Thiogranum longum]